MTRSKKPAQPEIAINFLEPAPVKKKTFKPWQGIVKVQVALGGDPAVLVYNESRYIFAQFLKAETDAETWAQLALHFKDEPIPKIYMRAKRLTDGTLVLMEKVGDQPW